MAKQNKTYLIKVQDYFNQEHVEIIGEYTTKEEAKDAADNYQKALSTKTKRFKREFCNYCESDGIHKGWFFTIF